MLCNIYPYFCLEYKEKAKLPVQIYTLILGAPNLDWNVQVELRELSLLGNMVQRLPDDFTRLTNLELLQLDGQNFDSIPADITEQGGKRILEYIRKMALADTTATLDLSGMRVQQLPAAVCMIKSLQHLFLHNNPIAKLPPMIVQLTNLKTLTLNVSMDLI